VSFMDGSGWVGGLPGREPTHPGSMILPAARLPVNAALEVELASGVWRGFGDALEASVGRA